MSLFYMGDNVAVDSIRGISFETLHKHQCGICPLNKQSGFEPKHPHMPAYGNESPRVYMLGEAPGKQEDEQGIPFVGSAGQYLHEHIPPEWEEYLRWNNCVRTRPKGNETPNTVAIEACRPSVTTDVETSQPEALFGFGNIPLRWATSQTGITDWRGRRTPIRVGQHACWFFPMLHPSYILHLNNDNTRKQYEQMKFVFALDLQRAFAAVETGLPEPIIHSREEAQADVDCLYNIDAILHGFTELWDEPLIGVDLETNGIRPYQGGACILSAAFSGKDRTISFPLYHREAKWTADERNLLEEMLLCFLTESNSTMASFALPFELEWLGHFYGKDIIRQPRWGDAQAQAFLLDGRSWKMNSLDALCLERFGISIKAISNADRGNLDNTPLSMVLPYNGIDAKYHRLCFEAQDLEIAAQGLQPVYQHHISRTQAAVLCQIKGVPVDQQVAEALAHKYEQKLTEVEDKIDHTNLAIQFKERYFRDYRPSAPQDAVKAFSLIGVSLSKTTEEEIEKINDPLAKLHLQWKEAAKILSTYINPCRWTDKETRIFPDGRLHPILSLHRTRTWRSSAADPSIQNFPKHYGDAHEVRDMVRAPVGYNLVSFDYGQIQARNVAMESKDRKLVKSFWDRHDIHSDWRDRIFQLHPKWAAEGLKTVLNDKKLMKWYRNRAKNGFVFASFFGAGGKKVASTLGVPEHVGYKLAEEFDAAFPELFDWQKGQHEHYNSYGHVTGLSGFRRYAPVAHTEIINTPIQSDEAIMVFDGMVRLCETGDERLVPILMVHDDLTFLWHRQDVDALAEQVISTLLACPFPWSHIVPLSVEMSVGDSWDSMSEAGTFESDKWKAAA